MTNELRERLKAMNPEPFEGPSSDELATVLAAIEARRSTMTTDKAHDTTHKQVPFLRRPLVAFVGTAVFLIVVIGGGILLLSGADDPVAGTVSSTTLSPTTDAAPAVEEATVTTETPPPTTEPIISLPLLEVAGDPGIEGLVSCPDKVMLASSDAGTVVLVTTEHELLPDTDGSAELVSSVEAWWSTDGSDWEPLGVPAAFDVLEQPYGWLSGISDLVHGPAGFVAVGNLGYDAGVWFSPDGIDWLSIEADAFTGNDIQSIGRVVSGDFGYLAVGRAGSNAGVWLSEDGVTWALVADPDLGDGLEPTEMFDAVVSDDGFVAIGEAGFDRGNTGLGTGRYPVVWVSANGEDWERVDAEGLPTESTQNPTTIETIPGGFVLKGTLTYAEPVVWLSPNGRDWTDAEARFAGDVAPDGSGYAMVGIDETGTIWATDRFDAEPQAIGALVSTSRGDIGTNYQLVDVDSAATPDGLTIIGQVSSDTGCDIAFWHAPWNL